MRRPLGPDLRPSNTYLSPCDRLLGQFGVTADILPPYMQWTHEPRFLQPDLLSLARVVGLPEVPGPRTERYPARPLDLQHPTTFLQWGWSLRPNRQALLEIGDASFLVSAHFMKAQPGRNMEPWHLDRLIIDTGCEETYSLPCDDADYDAHVRRTLDAVRASVSLLCADNWRQAEKTLHAAMRAITTELDDISDRLARQHAAEWHASLSPRRI